MKNKGMRPAFSWLDVEPEEHAVAFTVAKAMEIDVLQAIRGEVQRALDEGLPLAAFKKNFRDNPALTEWWGRKEMVDPLTGKKMLAQLGSPRRLKTIYNANIRSARAAGQWERIERTKDAFPFLEYRLGPSEHHRAHHEDKAGLILGVDNPFWDEWMPPNGWGCKCWVRQVTKREAERRGVSVTPDVADKVWVNKRTGEQRIIPQGIDPGWQRNPGKLRIDAMTAVLRDKLEALPPEVAKVALRDIATSWRAERVLAGTAPGAVPVAVLPVALARTVGVEATVVQTTSDYGQKFIDKSRPVSTATLLELAEAIEDGVLMIQKKGSQVDLLIASRTGAPWLFIIKALTATNELWIRSMYPLKPGKLKTLLENTQVEVLRR